MARGLMDSVIENSINHGLKHNLQEAMGGVGVKIAPEAGLWEYPEIIRNKMAVNTINGINIIGGDCIKINRSVDDNNVMNYEIITSIDSYKLKRPAWASPNNQWNKDLSVQTIFDDMFANILPNVRGIYAGDTTSSDYEGNDTNKWHNELFGVYGQKTGLKPSSKYLRLYLTSQKEPLYIFIGSYIEDITGGYNVTSSDTVDFKVDDTNGLLSAHINIISDEQLKSIGVIDNSGNNA